MTKYVAARANPALTWQNSRWLGADTVASLRTLKREDGPDLLVQGSGDLLQTLWKNALVDEFSVLIFPLVLGRGKRLFGDGTTPAGLTLVKARSFPTGVIVATYRPDGAVKTGDFQLAEPSAAEVERRRTLTCGGDQSRREKVTRSALTLRPECCAHTPPSGRARPSGTPAAPHSA